MVKTLGASFEKMYKKPLYKLFLFIFGIFSVPFVLFKYFNNRKGNEYEILKDDIINQLIESGLRDKIYIEAEEQLRNKQQFFKKQISDEELRNQFEKGIEKREIGKVTTFGGTALEAAYTSGEKWLDEVMVYIENNADFVIDYINKNIPEIKVKKPEDTYLLWLDFRGLNKTAEEIQEALVNIGKVALNDGSAYGHGGSGFFRINVGCPRSRLEDGLSRVKKAVESLK